MEQDYSQKRPIIIAHRGAQSMYPEHTMEGYRAAIALGADFIEPDLVLTKDRVFVARHEPYISTTTNVAEIEHFKNRKTTKIVDGIEVTDWFVSDFTLEELKTLKARQSWKDRPHTYDDHFEIPTLEEIIAFAKANYTKSGNPVGVYPELKHPTYHRDLNLPMEDQFLMQISKAGLHRKEDPIFVQCFEVATLQYLRSKSSVKLIQLIGAAGITPDGELLYNQSDGSYDTESQPYDFVRSNDSRNYGFFASEEGMKFVASYADGIGPWKPYVITIVEENNGNNKHLKETDFVKIAHAHKLQVHPYTFREEDTRWNIDTSIEDEYTLFFNAGVDGVFTDYTAEAVKSRSKFLKE